MFENVSNFNVEQAPQINANNYENRSKTLNAVTVQEGGQYTKVEINSKENHRHVSSDPLNKLYEHTTVAAMHNAAERADAPKCHEETRKAVQQNIFSWIDSSRGSVGPPGQILWLTGPAGAGKSAIMGSVANALQAKGQLAASFYFASYMGTAGVKSKRQFVTTLAYQLQRHPSLKEDLSETILSTIEKDPAIFDMSLKDQMDELVLRPLQRYQARHGSLTSALPLVIVIDGVDECGEDTYDNPNRSRETDQVDVLSVLFHAMSDPSFPCRIIIASRPENCLRRFFTEATSPQVTEIFLDNKYDPDSDIELFLRSRFAEIRRKYRYDLSEWPAEQDIKKLVEDSSGQFVYAATVIRFIDSAWPLPKHQLDVVLKVRPLIDSSPFRLLDALYTAILNLSPSPQDTVLWLKAAQRLTETLWNVKTSAWTVDRLFESVEGQAQAILRLPSLVHLTRSGTYDPSDFSFYARKQGATLPSHRPEGWDSFYAFYHKSFLDYLEDKARCGAAFPGVDDVTVRQWIWGRFSKVLQCDGPEVPFRSEVPFSPELLEGFRICIVPLLSDELARSKRQVVLSQHALASSDPDQWLPPMLNFRDSSGLSAFSSMFALVHRECRLYRPCLAGCKRWRTEMKRHRWAPEWNSLELLLDRFCIKRVTSG